MQKVFNLIVERLENHKDCYEKVIGKVIVNNYDINLERADLMNCAIEIVKQVAEEYKHKLNMCNNSFYENMPQDFQDAVKVIMGYCQHEDCAYSCDDCSNCPNPLSVIRCGDTLKDDGWIPCEERLPDEDEYVLCFLNEDNPIIIHTIIIARYDGCSCWHNGTVLAWQPLPTDYVKGE